MARTNRELVIGILDYDVGFVPDLTPFIDFANELVTEKCASVYLEDGVTPFYTDNRLKMIETWLAAHAYHILDKERLSSQVESIREQVVSKVDLGLNLTHYGQQAMRLDTNGGLAAMNNAMNEQEETLPAVRVRKRILWLGTDSCG